MTGRIRTIKPEFFRHEGLYELERETGLPIRVAFAGLFCCADRDGRFDWRPRQLKLDVLPWDECDFSRVLDALTTRGFIRRYASEGREYGCIPSWSRHQVINNREKASEIPNILDCQYVSDACATREARDTVITQGKGREGKGNRKGREGEVALADACATRNTWGAYSQAYLNRYGVLPTRNAKVNGQVAQFCQRIAAEDAPHVAAFYVGHNSAYYVRAGHTLGALLQDAEKLRTEWATNNRITETAARQIDSRQTQGDVWNKLIAEAEHARQS